LLNGIARLALAAPRRVLAVAVLMAAIAIFGLPVIGSLSAGGMRDPDAE
jgi:RND superfamily putative drug exporter